MRMCSVISFLFSLGKTACTHDILNRFAWQIGTSIIRNKCTMGRNHMNKLIYRFAVNFLVFLCSDSEDTSLIFFITLDALIHSIKLKKATKLRAQ